MKDLKKGGQKIKITIRNHLGDDSTSNIQIPEPLLCVTTLQLPLWPELLGSVPYTEHSTNPVS